MKRVYLSVAIDIDDDDPVFKRPSAPDVQYPDGAIEVMVRQDVHRAISDIGYTGQVIVTRQSRD